MKRIFYLSVFTVLVASCSSDDDKKAITQFASEVIGFSSEYNPSPGDWSAAQVLGEPDVYPDYGDYELAWASLNEDDDREYLEFSFTKEQTVKMIEVYETYNPGAVDTLYLRNASTQAWVKVWSTTAEAAAEEARILAVTIDETDYKADAIRIAINSGAVSNWNEIDAVSITGNE